MSLPDFVRVRDKHTGHHYSVRYPDPAQHQILKQPAVDENGRPLPAKPKVDLDAASGDSTTSSDHEEQPS